MRGIVRAALCLVPLLSWPALGVRITEATHANGGFGICPDFYGGFWYTKADTIYSTYGFGAATPRAFAGAVELTACTMGLGHTLWVLDTPGNKVWRYDPETDVATPFTVPTAASQPTGIAFGPDGNIWFTEFAGNKIGRITPTGVFTEFPIVNTPTSQPHGIAASATVLWFVEYNGNKLGRITPAGTINEFDIPTAGAFPTGIAVGTTLVAFAEQGQNKIGLFHQVLGGFSEATIPTPSSAPARVVAAIDDAFWFTELIGNRIGRVASSTDIVDYPVPTAASSPRSITATRNGDLWFTEEASGKLGRVELHVLGDVNGDGGVNVADVFYLINFLFAGGSAPK